MDKKTHPWLMLFSRITLFFAVQAIFAVGFALAGSTEAWEAGANWWPLTVAIADAICLALLIYVFKASGQNFWGIFRIERGHIASDLLVLLGLTILAAPVTYLPNVWLGGALFGASDATLDLIVRPLPVWAVWLGLFAFPILQGLTELPTYFGFVMPRFEAQGMKKLLAIILPSSMLALQHIAAPLLFDMRFIAWRGLMFVPFAFVVGFVFHWRPRLLPYFVVVHVLMNMSFVVMFLSAAY
jgi:membrane protease YdiL (CAAX protease family)